MNTLTLTCFVRSVYVAYIAETTRSNVVNSSCLPVICRRTPLVINLFKAKLNNLAILITILAVIVVLRKGTKKQCRNTGIRNEPYVQAVKPKYSLVSISYRKAGIVSMW